MTSVNGAIIEKSGKANKTSVERDLVNIKTKYQIARKIAKYMKIKQRFKKKTKKPLSRS